MGVTDLALKDLKLHGILVGDTNLLDAAQNIQAGTAYLNLLLTRYYDGNLSQVLYHYGNQTSSYVTQILRAEKELEKNPSDPIDALTRTIGKR